MIKHRTPGIVVDNTSGFFRPDATCKDIIVLEAARDHHAGVGQGGEPERHVSRQKVDSFKEHKQVTKERQ